MKFDQRSFDDLAETLRLDEFERIALYELHRQIQTSPNPAERERLTIEIGRLLEPNVERWINEGGQP